MARTAGLLVPSPDLSYFSEQMALEVEYLPEFPVEDGREPQALELEAGRGPETPLLWELPALEEEDNLVLAPADGREVMALDTVDVEDISNLAPTDERELVVQEGEEEEDIPDLQSTDGRELTALDTVEVVPELVVVHKDRLELLTPELADIPELAIELVRGPAFPHGCAREACVTGFREPNPDDDWEFPL